MFWNFEEAFLNFSHLQSCKNRPQVAALWLCLKVFMHMLFTTVHPEVILLSLTLFLLCLCILINMFIYVCMHGCNFPDILI